MASTYTPNKWELYDPNLPNEIQVNSYITKRRLDHMEEGIRTGNIKLEIGTVTVGSNYGIVIVEDKATDTRRLNVTFPPAGKGDPGEDGKSAYQTWVELGNTGTEQEFIDYLKGIDGKDGKDGKDGIDGLPGPTGESAYQSWLSMGNTGTLEDFINSLKGADGQAGPQGEQGIPGKDNYEIWKSLPGNENKSVIEFFESLKGEPGPPGNPGSIEFVDFSNII